MSTTAGTTTHRKVHRCTVSAAGCGDHCDDCGAHVGHHKPECPTRSDGSACPIEGCNR